MKSFTLRTRFKKEIISEFVPPPRPSKKVIIFCGGMPGVPAKKELLFFFAKKNYWVFFPRYRGSWESGGSFLKLSPEQDILDIIDGLPRGFRDLWSGKTMKVKPEKLYLFGSSFGGPAAILASRDPRVTKTVALSPVIDWRVESGIEPLDWLGEFTQSAFGMGYRFMKKDWDKLKGGKFYNPAAHVDGITPNKVLLVHAKDDDVVSWKPTAKFARETGSKLILLRRGGHLGGSYFIKPGFYKRIEKFLKS